MSKKWLYILMVAVLALPLILTACGSTEAPEAPVPTEAPAAAPTEAPAAAAPTEAEAPAAEGMYEEVDPSGQTVLWWHQHTRERQEGLNQMVDEFNETNPWGITVVAEYAGGYPEIYDKMIAAISADDPTLLPNLTVGYANQVAKYELSEALVDMDEFVNSAEWGLTEEEVADFPVGIFEADVAPIFGDGHFRMGFPPNRSMEMLYYNLDWLNELGYDGPPETWAEFKEMACAATDPAAGTVGYEISTDASRFASMVFSRHGTYFLPDGSAFDFQNDTVKETMRFIKELYDEGCVTLIAESYGDQTDFGNYKTLFTIGSSSGLPYYDQAVKSGEQGEFQWGVAALPYMDGGTEPVMNLYGASVSVPKTTPEQELAAWLFVKWYTEPEQNARWAKISQYFPVRESAAESMADYFAENPTFKQAFDLLPYSTYEAQWCPCYEEVRRSMNDAYSAILDGADIDETLAQLEADANASLAENLPGGALPIADLWGQVQVAGKLVVSSDPNYAPQSFLNDAGELDGFDIDVSKAVAERLGVEVEFVTPDWDLITAGNWGGRWDISIGSMTPTEARAEVLWFTDPYYYTPAVFAVHADNTDIASPDDLSGKKVGLGTATTYESYLDGTLSIMGGEIIYDPPSGVTVQPYSTDVEAIEDLILGDGVRLDAVMTAAPTVQNAIDEGLPLKYVGTPAFYEPLAFSLDKARGPSDNMVNALNDILADLHEDGTLSELSMKWYGVDITTLVMPEEGAAPSAPAGDVPEEMTIAWIPKALNNPVFEIGRDGAFKKAEELTAETGTKVEVMYVGSVASDAAEQARVVEDVIAKGVNAIGISCNDPTACEDPINKAVAAGIPVMAWDSDSPDSDRFTYLGVDNYQGGKAAAELLVKFMGEEGKVALLTGVPGAFNLEERIRGFQDGVADYPGIEIVSTVYCNDDINLGVQVVEETMQAHPDLDGWFFVGLWPLFAERGSMPLWEDASLNGMTNIVFDTLPVELEFMQDGYVQGLVGQKYWGWGYDTVQMIYDYIVNGATYDDWTDSGMDIVTECNVDVMADAWANSDFTAPLPDPYECLE